MRLQTCFLCANLFNASCDLFFSHKGCGARLSERTESCGEMFDNIFWLCSQCLSGYEVSYGNFCITWNQNFECSICVKVGKKIRNVDVMTEVHKNGALSLSVTFEELAPNIGLSSMNKVKGQIQNFIWVEIARILFI